VTIPIDPNRSVPKHILAVSALISRDDGQVLLMRHPRRGWEFPGGQVEQGETLLQALRREIIEETGVTIEAGKLVGVYTNVKPPAKLIFGFLGKWTSGDLITSEESLETEWVRREQVLERVIHPAIYGRMKDMLEFQDRIVYRVYTTEPYQVLEEYYL